MAKGRSWHWYRNNGVERYYSADAELDAWMQKHGVTEENVLEWVHGPSLWQYVVKRLKQLGRRAA